MSDGGVDGVDGGGRDADQVGEGRRAVHGSFALDVSFAASPEQVYAAFAEAELRVRWFRLPGRSGTAEHELDFRVGGGESARNVFVSGDVEERLEYRSRFVDLVPARRLVYVYEAHVDGVRRWVSLVTIELGPQDGGTRLDWTEQYTYLVLSGGGAQDTAHLRGGTRLVLNGLAAVLAPAH